VTEPEISLRDVRDGDLEVFFDHQRDPGAVQMVGLPSRDRPVFDAHWARIRRDDSVALRTVVVDGAVAGNLLSFVVDGRREVGYWLGREFWGRGVATRALAAFLREVTERPLHAGVVPHNAGSLRVLERCGFVRCGTDGERILLELAR